VPDSLQRINVNEVTNGEFIERFEKPYLPVVLIGDQDGWQARHKWTLKRLGKK